MTISLALVALFLAIGAFGIYMLRTWFKQVDAWKHVPSDAEYMDALLTGFSGGMCSAGAFVGISIVVGTLIARMMK